MAASALASRGAAGAAPAAEPPALIEHRDLEGLRPELLALAEIATSSRTRSRAPGS